ncbi:uncharacterized protein UV8b_02497 [Ustilaginoidea virens]|uniref:Uncharacterized protein n=1 Tax=Ustilaginoidea virens TaxID=1159556 RepID=A0A8E5MFT3_USTVR|nr:uncharacterized protein UV8b_02497 [Ustilaginoidea virens]QUC18256.1 hypothetical protein UV8b_02497 [Ustilaginoidea virens]
MTHDMTTLEDEAGQVVDGEGFSSPLPPTSTEVASPWAIEDIPSGGLRPIDFCETLSSQWKLRVFNVKTTLRWRVDGNTRIHWIAWMARSDLVSEEETIDKLTAGLPTGDRKLIWPVGNDASGVTLEVTTWASQRTYSTPHRYQPQPGDYMRLKIAWTNQDTQERGNSTTGLFTVAEGTGADSTRGKWSDDIFNHFNSSQKVGGIDPSWEYHLSTSSSHDTQSAHTTAAFPPIQASSPSSGGLAPSQSGLSTGAIAGLTVGCGIALVLIIIGLVWFPVVRRRRQKQQSYDAQDKASACVEDKSAPVAQHDDSGRSPSSEDNTRSSQAVNPVAALLASSRSELGPAHPRLHDAQEEPSRHASRAVNYAEQGMSDEERRRWEEEERQLDDEIARARGC